MQKGRSSTGLLLFPQCYCSSRRCAQPFITPSSRPILMNAAIARSRCSRVCAADICVRMRAWPCGTTGKKKPIA